MYTLKIAYCLGSRITLATKSNASLHLTTVVGHNLATRFIWARLCPNLWRNLSTIWYWVDSLLSAQNNIQKIVMYHVFAKVTIGKIYLSRFCELTVNIYEINLGFVIIKLMCWARRAPGNIQIITDNYCDCQKIVLNSKSLK